VAANVVDEAGDRIPERVPEQPSANTMVLARPGHEVAPPDSATRAFLLVRTDGAALVRFNLGGALISIGRASDNDVIVDDPEVSRHHCQLKLQHGAYSFADLGSRNGSLVNGQAVSEVALGPGDSIQIGSTQIQFEVGG
jgi:pSer/pThr/pTyr-binding forkhead associated (FHA) protein